LPIILERQWRLQATELLPPAAADTMLAGPDIPARFTLSVPRSACPACQAPITVWQNIPIVSWLVLRGRCAACKAPISARYPLVELATAALSAAVAWHFDRTAFDRIMLAGGFISVNTGNAPEANALPVSKEIADLAMDAAACIGCGACVAVCKNASAMLFVAAKVSHLNYLPQGQAEKDRRVKNMVLQMDREGFGNCTVTGSCEAVCPKEISLDFIAKMNRDYAVAVVKGELKPNNGGGVG
ncbi:MAG: prepilin peptidase, partial [Limisphaerales bacterium]